MTNCWRRRDSTRSYTIFKPLRTAADKRLSTYTETREQTGKYYAGHDKSPDLENPAGFRLHLFCMGVHLSRDSRRRTRSATLDFCGHAVSDCGARSLWLGDDARRAPTDETPMDVRILSRSAYL